MRLASAMAARSAKAVWRYPVAVGAAAAALALSRPIDDLLGPMFSLFPVGVVGTVAGLAGTGPGLVSAGLLCVGLAVQFQLGVMQHASASVGVGRFAVLAIAAVSIALISGAERFWRQRLAHQRSLLETAQRMASLGSFEQNELGDAEWSPQLFVIFGRTRADEPITLEKVMQWVHPDDRDRVSALLEDSERTISPLEIEHRIVRPDGTERTVLVRTRMASCPEGRPPRLIGSVLDVTELRRTERDLRESEERFRLLAENSQDVIFRYRLRPERGYEYVSPSAASITGYSVAEHYADPDIARKLIHPEDRSMLEMMSQPDFQGGIVQCRWVRRDGSVIWAEQRLTPVRNERGELVALDGIARDITQRKHAEQALIDADRRKDEFLAVLSHELRNPLAPVRNSLFVLQNAPPDSPQHARARAIIERQVTHIVRLVDDLLDVSRIARGKIELERELLDLAELGRRVAEDYRDLLQSAQLELVLDVSTEPVWVDGDATRLAQVIGNLFNNSIKFTPAGGKVELQVRRAASRTAVLRVRDSGIGIEPKLLESIFQPFAQADRSSISSGGLGLGLALVRGLIELHGGEVHARSPGNGGGAEFTLSMPLADAPSAWIDRAELPPDSPPARVLLVEDDPDAASSLRDALELRNHLVQLASSGPEGVQKVRSFHPDVVLCDIGLPGMDGYEVARTIRADTSEPRPFLVALTGFASSEDRRHAIEAGFDAHLPKPPPLETIEGILRAGRSRRRPKQS